MLNVLQLSRSSGAPPVRRGSAASIMKALRIPLLSVAGLLPLGNLCLAQDVVQPAPVRREFESRAELEAQAKQAEAQHRSGEAWLLKQRLERGDFQDGDRILIKVQGNALAGPGMIQFPETLTVRAGKKLELPRMPDLSLDGVLRSELNERLAQHIGQYFREPTVRSTPLVRMAILGTVGHPGYLYTSADSPLSDVIMQAGGPTANADMAGVTIRRGADVIWNAQDTQAALADGLSVDRLHLRAGDEVTVPETNRIPWLLVLPTVLSIAGLAFSLLHR
jgi:protein involved in polysaccharide export with SLBB domain